MKSYIHSFLKLCLILFSSLTSPIVSQTNSAINPEKTFFKGVNLNTAYFTLEINQITATENSFNSLFIISNTSDRYIIINPLDLFGTIVNDEVKWRAKRFESIIIEPKKTETFEIKFKGRDFRVPELTLNINKVQITDSVASVYDFKDLPLAADNHSRQGPVYWSMTNKDFDIHKGIRVTAKLKYKGTKFLVIALENAFLKTNDGGTFYNVGEEGGMLRSYNYPYFRPYYVFEKEVLFFPAKRIHLKKEMKATVNLINVFKEYNTKALDDLKINLIQSK